jgi:DNA-binding NarL/FixJ family response regulator
VNTLRRLSDVRYSEESNWVDPLIGKDLTGRQMAIVRYLQEGYDYEEVGRLMFCTSRTVKNQMRYISRKLGHGPSYNRMRIVVELMRRGVLT